MVGYYLNQSIETELGQTDQGVQLALYFKRNAATIKSAYSILGDPALYKVVKTVFNLPDNMGKVDIAQQKRIVDAKLNVNDLQDPDEGEQAAPALRGDLGRDEQHRRQQPDPDPVQHQQLAQLRQQRRRVLDHRPEVRRLIPPASGGPSLPAVA